VEAIKVYLDLPWGKTMQEDDAAKFLRRHDL
jgi:hypothetical protein